MNIEEAQHEFLDKIIGIAVRYEDMTGIPAEVVVGQAIMESSWGQSLLAKKANNLFGIKADHRWDGPVTVMTGSEYENGRLVKSSMQWRRYPSIVESVLDHEKFLRSKRYNLARSKTNYRDFLYELQRAGYATDPMYADKIIQLIKSRGIAKKIEDARMGRGLMSHAKQSSSSSVGAHIMNAIRRFFRR